jgi:hypothetical protein
LLQGWLESLERRLRRLLKIPCRWLGAVPIVAIALLFSFSHYRDLKSLPDIHVLLEQMRFGVYWELLFLAFLVAWLKFGVGATATDLGVDYRKIPGDIALGLGMTFVVFVLTYSARFFVAMVYDRFFLSPWADPIFLIPLALALGFVYYRTHRIVPCIALHATFNGLGVVLGLFLEKCVK